MFTFLRRLFITEDHPIFAELDQAPSGEFVYVKIPESLMPMDRGDKYDDPLLAILEEKQAGEVTGGGSSLGEKQADGTCPIKFVGVDVDLVELESGLAIVREALLGLDAPPGTEIHYTRDGRNLQDELTAEGWKLEQERTALHPGFGI